MYYLDHAAATPVSPKALAAMLPYFSEHFFNPSAPYLPAKRVHEAYESAKNDLAHVIGAKGVDLVMTAGATESINLAFTALDQFPEAKCLTLTTEHAAVLEAAKSRQYELISVDKNGLIQLDDLRKKLSDDVALVSISLANNELGTIQPLAEISEILRQARQNRLQRGITLPLFLHSDASQALSLIDINASRLGVDLLTLNAAKCGGPKGVGALYVARHVKLHPLNLGGGQERGLRSGTENVPGVIGFAQAAVEAKTHLSSNRKQYQKMADIIRQELKNIAPRDPHTPIISHNAEKVNTEITKSPKIPPQIRFLGNHKHQLANFIPVCFPGIDAERLVYRLEMRGVLVSTGAACAANKGTKSHVLQAIGLSDSEIAGSLRISLGSTNTIENVTAAARIIREEVMLEYQRAGFAGTCCVAETVSAECQRAGFVDACCVAETVSAECQRAGFVSACCEKLKERPAGREERAPRKDGRANGFLKTSTRKAGNGGYGDA